MVRKPESITPEFVAEQVAYLAGMVGDPESFHQEEDDLHCFVLRMIAEERTSDAVQCAAEALKTLQIDATRWFA